LLGVQFDHRFGSAIATDKAIEPSLYIGGTVGKPSYQLNIALSWPFPK